MLHFLENEDSYDSTTSSTATASSTSTQPSRAVRKGSRKYYFSTTHDSYDDAVRVVEQEKMWRKSNMTKTTQYYLCNRVTTRNPIQCAAALYIYINQDTQKTSIYRTTCAHTHGPDNLKVNIPTREFVKSLLENHKMKPNVILENIEREKNNLNLKVPLKKDLNNFLYTLQKKKVGKSTMTIGDLAKLCEENSQIPDDEHEQ
jgi:hypothetical protein